jgi:hypothetical protein
MLGTRTETKNSYGFKAKKGLFSCSRPYCSTVSWFKKFNSSCIVQLPPTSHNLIRRTSNNMDGDRSYQQAYKLFKAWVAANTVYDSDTTNHVPRIYLTRANIDLYFTSVVEKKEIKPTSASRIIPALQFFSDHHERKGESPRFIVKSPITELALKRQQLLYKASTASSNVDPHINLPTDVLTINQVHNVATFIIEKNYQMDLLFAWTVLFTTLIRGNYFRSLTLSSLRADVVNGPLNSDGVFERVLTFILRGRGVKNLSETHVTGCLRHKNVFFALSLLLSFSFR